MEIQNGRQYFGVGLDLAQLRQGSSEARSLLHSIGQQAVSEGNEMDAVFNKMRNTVAGVFAISQIKEFVGQIITTRGEIQSMEVAFRTLLGNKEKADEMFAEIRKFAVSTPMMVKDLASGAQQMLAFGIDAERIMPMLRSLGDISMGDSQKFQSLTLAFSQMSATGKLMGQDLLQMINAGFNPLQVIAEQTGKSIGELKDEMSKGAISAEMVAQAFLSATSEGGKFHDMLKNMSGGVEGQMSNLQGAIDDMMNELGEQLQGTVSAATTAATYLIQHYEPLLTILGTLVATYGTYKAALMVNAAVEAVVAANRATGLSMIEAEITAIGTRTAAEEIATDVQIAEAVAKGDLTEAEALHILSLKNEAAARVQGLEAAAAQANADLAAAAAAEQAALVRLQAAEAQEAAAVAQLAMAEAQGEAFVVASAKAEVNTAVNLRNAAAQEYQAAAAAKDAAARVADTAATEAHTAAVALNTIGMQKGTMQAGLFRSAMNLLDGALEKVAATLKAHPYAAVAAAVVALSVAVYKLVTYESEATKATNAMHDAANRATADFVAEESKLAALNNTLKTTKKGSEKWLAAKNEIIKNYSQYHSGLDTEIEKVGYLKTSYDALTKAIKKSIYARQMKKYSEDYMPDTTGLYAEILNTADKKPLVPNWQSGGDKFVEFTLTQEEKEALMERMQQFVEGKDVKWTTKESQFLNWKGGLLEHNLYINRLRKMRGEMSTYLSNLKALRASSGVDLDDMDEENTTVTPTSNPTKTSKTSKTSNGKDNTDQLAARAIEQTASIKQYTIDVANEAKQAEFEIEQARIDAMNEGMQKTLAQNELNYNRLKEQTRVRAEDMVADLRNAMQTQWEMENPNATDTQKAQHKVDLAQNVTADNLNPDDIPVQFREQAQQIVAMVNQYDQIATQAFNESNRKALAEALSDVQTYTEQREKIVEDYARREAELYNTDADGNKTLKDGVSQGNVDELNRQRDEALTAVDEQFASRENEYESWCNAIANLSLQQLEGVLANAKTKLEELQKSGKATDSQLAVARAKVATATKKVERAKSDNDVSPKKRSIKEWQDLYKTLNDVKDEFEEIGDTVGGVVGDIISECGEMAASTLSMINGIKTLVNNAGTGIEETAESGATAISTMEKASVILTIISAALQIAMAIVNLFNNDDKKQEEIDELQKRIDQLQWELDNADVVRSANLAESGSYLGQIRKTLKETRLELAQAAIATKDWYKAIRALYVGASYNTELMTATVEKLAKAYGNMAYTADKALGAEKYAQASDELKNIAQQQLLINEQIADEKSKKDSDDDAITEYEQKIEELGQQALEIINDMMEDIIGDTSTGIAESLADAFFEAFEAGEDAAEAWGDKVDEIVGDILKNLMVTKFLEEPLGELFNKYKAKWFPDGQFAGLDAVINSMNDFANDLNAELDSFSTVMDALPDELKQYFIGDIEDEREASSGSIAEASQESVDELNGRATAIQGHTYSISENTKTLVANTTAILASVLNIEGYTNTMAEEMVTLRTDLRDVRATLSNIQLHGLRLSN